MTLIAPCKCGDIGRPFLYGHGEAKEEVAGPGATSEVYFTNFYGYVVECEKCGRTTEHFKTPDEAIDAWNRGEAKKPVYEELIKRIEDCLDWYKKTYEELKKKENRE